MTVTPLTDREEEVRAFAASGLGSEEIAARLSISKRTVEAHLHNVYRKLGVRRRDQLATALDRVQRPAPAAVDLDGALGLKAENERLTRQVASYDAAMRQLIERHFPLFEERVEITVTIGGSAGEDIVVERHWSTPKPYLPCRVARPIRPRGATQLPYDELGLTCEVVGRDIGVNVQPILEPRDRLLVLLFFQPGLHASTEWVLHYRTPGLFDPLRSTGEQDVTWSTNTLDNPSTPGIGDVTFYFDFPGDENAGVTQDRQTGDMKEDRLPGGGARFTWHNFVPGRHTWTLRMPTPGR